MNTKLTWFLRTFIQLKQAKNNFTHTGKCGLVGHKSKNITKKKQIVIQKLTAKLGTSKLIISY
jgi:hypothetical protein